MKLGIILRNLLFTAIGLGVIAGSQFTYDHSATSFAAQQKDKAARLSQPLVPGTEALKILSLGDGQLAADILWLDMIQYFGQGDPYGKYAALAPMLDRITQLDPNFEYPNEFALIVLPFMGATDTAIAIGERAQTTFPNNGLLTYYLATDYHLDKKDYVKAAYYYEKAAKEPGAPPAAIDLAAVAQSRINNTLDDRIVAIGFWQTVKDRAQTDEDAKRAQDWIDELNIVLTLEKASMAYHDRHQAYPQTLQDLVTDGLVSEIPPSPVNRAFILDPKTGKVSFAEN